MKKKISYLFHVLTSFILLNNYAFSQTQQEVAHNDSIYRTWKLDTIEADFVMEVLSKYKFYTYNDAGLQTNLMFINNRDFVNNPASLYYADSVFIDFCDLSRKYFKGGNVIDYKSISEFTMKTDEYFAKDKASFRSSKVEVTDDVVFLKFHAKIVVLNIREKIWKIPKIYAKNCNEKFKFYECCERKFANTFLLASVLDFQYYDQYIRKHPLSSKR
jgi:hypothetical protein